MTDWVWAQTKASLKAWRWHRQSESATEHAVTQHHCYSCQRAIIAMHSYNRCIEEIRWKCSIIIISKVVIIICNVHVEPTRRDWRKMTMNYYLRVTKRIMVVVFLVHPCYLQALPLGPVLSRCLSRQHKQGSYHQSLGLLFVGYIPTSHHLLHSRRVGCRHCHCPPKLQVSKILVVRDFYPFQSR